MNIKLHLFIMIMKWVWRGYEIVIDLMPPDENGSVIGLQITIGDFTEEELNK